MNFAIKKNSENTWNVTPVEGKLAGLVVATVEALDLTSVLVGTDRVVGTIKAVWGLQPYPGIDLFDDQETMRALCLNKVFKGSASSPVDWRSNGIYNMDTNRLLRNCQRMVMFGSKVFSKG